MQKPTRKALGDIIEQALMSGGIIILITAGGGAFGAMLKEAQIGAAIKELFADTHASADLLMLGLGFGVALPDQVCPRIYHGRNDHDQRDARHYRYP